VTEPVDTEKGVTDGFFLTSNVHNIHFWPGVHPQKTNVHKIHFLAGGSPRNPLGELMTLMYAYKSADLI